MKFLLDFGPIVIFFIAYKAYDLNVAIIAMIASTLAQIMYTRLSTGKFVTSQVLTFVLLIVFGGISLFTGDVKYLMWKVSVTYVIFAIVMIGSNWIGSKTLLERMMGKELEFPRVIWSRLSWIWGFGFMGIAFVNAYIYVIPAVALKEQFMESANLIGQKIELKPLDCSQMPIESLCLAAQQAEAEWVNFKVFGALGLTVLLIVITVLLISKHIKEKQAGL